ncbi:SDR family oxidoreductase [Aureimonas fodinaquatilis]|uniref:SDR family oxidoreductase n=1 Tax=Aureimonas fodinaquatilis TaxID=2565783 RepID=A0A5B0DVX4_9HYPH|nr:SDR family NAD(P)-dependent oxidoreductase [Aureimonas fodinaquatilis]KAA0970904.1 SDR family oxidoreductase [Aureimonas fodinaquatilis]
MSNGRLNGRTAIVTGGAKGIGRAIAQAYAAEGASLMIADRNFSGAQATAQAIEAEGGVAAAFATDVTSTADVVDMVAATVQRFGTVDILVNNAGLLNACLLTDMSPEIWDDMIAVHMRGMFLCCRFAVPHMQAGGRGTIINMSGSFGVSGAASFTHLSAAKAGMIGFTQALAREVGPDNIRVNAIAPAIVETDLATGMSNDAIAATVATYPLRRAGTVSDIVPTAVFLASDDSAFYTGQTLCPAGGAVMAA